MKKERVFLLHPFLFAVYPVIALFIHNKKELMFSVVFIPIILLLLLTVFLLLSVFLVFKNHQKTAAIVSVFWILLFSYYHFCSILKGFYLQILNFPIGPGKFILLCFFIIFLGFASLVKKGRNLTNLTRFLNIFVSFLFLFLLLAIVFPKGNEALEKQKEELNLTGLTQSVLIKKPNIYYIILDAYARSDILKEVYNYDNSNFINYLAKKGFYIANKSRSNYHTTTLSIPSSLNLQYLANPEYSWAVDYNVFRLLKQLGYKTAVITSGKDLLNIKRVDVYKMFGLKLRLNDFQAELINLTPIRSLTPLSRAVFKGFYSTHRKRIIYVFDALKDTVNWEPPYFIFAYLFSPHPPFVFGPKGEEIQPNRPFNTKDSTDFILSGGTKDEYIQGYKDQVEFINVKLMDFIDHILTISEEPPIIVLQGDHGPRSMVNWKNFDKTYWKEPYSILNAYYFPDKDYSNLYESISPVNTFRVIFNLYFNAGYILLEDKSYCWDLKDRSCLIDVTDRINDASAQ